MKSTARTFVEVPAGAQPLLKWAGGKRQLLPEIRKNTPEKFGDYYEPFLGGAAVFFDLYAAGRLKPPHRAFLGDMNAELVETYKLVRDIPGDVITALRRHAKKHDAPLAKAEAYYYEVRASQRRGAELAARMIYLNRTGFNGLYRVNKKGGFNVPFGDYANPTICDAENLLACSRALRGTSIRHIDFEKRVVDNACRGDFVYFDPPYVPVSATSDFTSFTRDGFTLEDQKRLVECAAKLKRRGVHVLLSNADVPIVRKLYKGFGMRRIEARRNINSKGGKRGAVGELLIW